MKSLSPRRLIAFCAALLASFPVVRADIPAQIKPTGVGLGSFSYWSSSPFSNTALTGDSWIEYAPNEWGTTVYFQDTSGTWNPQFDANGYPQYLNTGKKLRMLLWPYNANNNSAPASWPKRANTGVGKWVVTWQGDADIRLNGATFVAAESSGASTGSLVNGRRVYIMGATNPTGHITVEAINAANPITDLKVWLPDPSDPQNKSLETSGQFWHPAFMSYLTSADFNHLRFMDWGATNASPQQDWVDRRLPSFVMQRGLLNRRQPATNSPGDRPTGIAYEYMIALCNATGKDMWVCIPHMATDDYVAKLAQLIRYGSDGVNPYTSPQANPVYPPLAPGRKVWVEYSNEIWSSGISFPQGNWAEAQGIAMGFTSDAKARFNGRRFAQVWQIFQQQYGGSSDLVRVAAIWTALSSYTTPFLTELRDYGATLTPTVRPDVIAPTTYFGNGIQDWAYEQANLNRGKATQWFHTASDFVYNTTTGATRPVSVPLSDPYWSSSQLAGQQAQAFVEWKKRIFSGSTASGGGFDSTGTGGGFAASLRTDIFNIFGEYFPIVSYEGGPSLYTDYMDGGSSKDDGVTNFVVTLNRRPEFAEIYKVQLNMARAKGLAAHSMFVDVSAWGKYGQWGHLEYMDQPLSESVKWTAVSDWAADIAGIHTIDNLTGSRPSFVTPGTLPVGNYLTPYSQDIVMTGGDVAPVPQIAVIGTLLDSGLTITPVAGDPWRYRVSGTPQSGGWNFVYLRVSDDDGDASWQVYSFYISGGPGTVVEADLSGTFSGASSLPWTKAYVVDSGTVSYSGFDRGAVNTSSGGSATGTDGTGVLLYTSTNAIRFSVSQGAASQSDSTLASAITDNEYWKFTVTPQPGKSLNLRNAEFKFSWMREDYHAPRKLAVFTTISGFTEGQQIYTLASMPDQGSVSEQVFRLPDTTAYGDITTPVEFRIYFYGSQYAHKAQLLGMKLTRDPGVQSPAAPVFTTDPMTRSMAAIDSSYSETIAGSAGDANGDLLTYSKVSGPAWLNVGANGVLTGTPSVSDSGTNSFTVKAEDPGALSDTATLNIVVAEQAVQPAIQPAPGTYSSPVTIDITTPETGAEIRYTLDGSLPASTTGVVYSGPFVLGTSATVNAIAFKNGFADSPAVSASYTISLAEPVSFEQTGTGDLVMEAEHYTALAANGDTKAWSVGTSAAGYQGPGYIVTPDTGATSPAWSSACEAAYKVNFSGTGTYYAWLRVNAPNVSGNEIYLGKNGSQIGASAFTATTTYSTWVWARYATSFTVSTTGTQQFQLRRREDGMRVDKIVLTQNSGTSYLSGSASPAESPVTVSVAAPVGSPAQGNYPGSVTVSLSTATAGASIRFTTDGSTPTPSSGTVYTAPLTFDTIGTTVVIKAIAYAAGAISSDVTTFTYTVDPLANVAFAGSSVSVPETSGSAQLIVRRNGSYSGIMKVQYATADVTAVAGNDYTATSGTLTWGNGDMADKVITVPVINDATYYEGDEIISVSLSNATGGDLGTPSNATVTILDDDNNAAPVVTRVAPANASGTTYLSGAVTLDYTVADDGFVEPVTTSWDKVSGPGVVTFDDSTAIDTIATFSTPGAYVIRLTALDGQLSTTSDLAVTVLPDPAPEIAVSRAGTEIANSGTDNFATFTTGSTQEITYTIANTGNAALNLGAATITGQTNAGAVILAQPASVIAGGSDTGISVSVTPGVTGAWSVALSIPTNDSDENPATWTLRGMGLSAATTFYWGGGTADITAPQPVPTTTIGLTGSWTADIQNWATSTSGTDYKPWIDGAFAHLGMFTDAASTSITLGTDVQVTGMMGVIKMISSDFNRFFRITGTAARTITPIGNNVVFRSQAADLTRGIVLQSNVSLAGATPITKDGYARLDVQSNSDAYTGATRIDNGPLYVNGGGSINGVTSFDLVGYPANATDSSYGSNSGFSSPTLWFGATSGANNKIADNATITIRRGEFRYDAAATSTETTGKIVLQSYGQLNFTNGTAGGILTLSDPSGGIDRGADGAGTMLVTVDSTRNPRTELRIQHPGTIPTDTLLPWAATDRAEFMQIESGSNNRLTRVASITAATDLGTWASTYDNTSVVRVETSALTGTIDSNATVRSLGLYSGTAAGATIRIGGSNTLTIDSGGIAMNAQGNFGSSISGGNLTTGTGVNRLYVGTGAVNTGNLFISSKLTGNFDLVKSGIVPLQLTGSTSNDYTGVTYVNNAHLAVNKSGTAIGIPGPLVIRPGASVSFSGTNPIVPAADVLVENNALLYWGSTTTIGGTLTIDGGAVLFPNTAPVLSKAGQGLLFNGGYFNQSSSSPGALNLCTNVSYAATANTQARFQRLGTATYNIELDGAERVFDVADSNTLPAGVPEMVVEASIVNGAGVGSLRKTGSGTLQFTGTNTYTGGSSIDGGMLQLATISAPAQSGLTAMTHGGGMTSYVLTFNEPITGTMVVGQSVTSAGIQAGRTITRILNEYEVLLNGVAASGASALLTDVAVSAYSRTGNLASGVTVNDTGILRVDSGSTVSGAVTVNAGGTLAGTGTIAGAATVAGTVSPGDSPGTITFGSSLNFLPGSTLAFELGTNSDAIAFSTLGDSLSGAGNVTLQVTPGPGFSYSNSYTIIDNVTTAGFTCAAITGYDTTNYTATLSKSGNAYVLSFAPESVPTFPEIDVTRGGALIANGGYDTVGSSTMGTPVSLNYSIVNSGSATLTLGTVSGTVAVNAGMVIDAQPSANVAVSGSTSLSVTVIPAMAGPWSVTLSFTTNDSDENPATWTISGTAQSRYTAWVNANAWGGADSSPSADPDQDGMKNLLEYAMDLDPLGGDPPSMLPEIGREKVGSLEYLTLTLRENNNAIDVTFTLQSTNDLAAPWTNLTVDGVNVLYEVLDPDVDGDGSASKVRYKVKLNPSDSRLYLRMQVTQ